MSFSRSARTHARRRSAQRSPDVEATHEVWPRGTAPYPPALLDLRNPPDPLYAVGDSRVLDRQAVAVVGARRASPTSLAFARRIGRTLARAGACVVSGLAVGVDAAAHEGALEGGAGRTCAVLGGGIDRGVTQSNRLLRERIAQHGLLLSEWQPGVQPDRWMFPHRNRLIAALAKATIVVEASAESGALHTVRAAIDLDRTIGVVPGPVDAEPYRGSNALLHHPGACVIVDPEDALALLSPRLEVTPPPAEFSDDAAAVWDVLALGAADVDMISIRSHLPITRCLAAITSLELAGVVECAMTGEIRRR
jgi:DNA processing protein